MCQVVELRRAMLTVSCRVEADAGLEFEGDVALLGGFDEVAAGDGHGIADALLVAAEDDADFGVVEDSRFFHGAERGEHDDESAFHVCDAGAGGDLAVAIGNEGVFLEGAGGFEDGVHVADEEELLAALANASRAGMLGDEIAGAVGLGLHGDPADFEAEGFEFGDEDVFDGFDSGEVHGSAVDVDELLEEGEVGVGVLVDGVDHLCFGSG